MIEFISKLREQSFEGWTEEATKGYLTALCTIEDRIDKEDRLIESIQKVANLFEDEKTLAIENPTYFTILVWHEIESLREENRKTKKRMAITLDENEKIRKSNSEYKRILDFLADHEEDQQNEGIKDKQEHARM